jgi:hypothetical protein
MIYAFDGCELDTDRYELRRDRAVVPLEPQVLDVLIHLVTHRDRLVTKVELLDEIWRDRFVANRHWPAASATCGAPLATMAGARAWSGPSTAAVSGSSPTWGIRRAHVRLRSDRSRASAMRSR